MYCDIFSGELKQSMAKSHDKDRIIDQRDLASWHAYDMVKAKMKKIKVKVLDRPAKSLDLNSIELIWSVLDKKLMNTPTYNKATVRKRIEEE